MDAKTPEFLRWSLNRECALRDAADIGDPEQVERQLRTLRAYSEAVASGREYDGICFEAALDAAPGPSTPPHGFRSSDVLVAYELNSPSHAPCIDCPAHVGEAAIHAASTTLAAPLVGCFGLVDWSPIANELDAAVRDTLSECRDKFDFQSEFLPTDPPWYGLWAMSPLRPPQLAPLAWLLDRLVARGPAWRDAFARLRAAVEVARRQRLELAVAYNPPGERLGRSWIVAAHCARCKAPCPETQKVCGVCGLQHHARPARRRLSLGRRPYWPLGDFLGQERFGVVLTAYLQQQRWTLQDIGNFMARERATQSRGSREAIVDSHPKSSGTDAVRADQNLP